MDDAPRVDGAGSPRDGCSLAPAGAPGGTSSCRAIYRLPQFTRQFVGLVIVLAAVWLALWPLTNISSRVVLAAIVLTAIFGCARTRRAAAVMLPALYVPHLWIFLIRDYPWSDYRWFWAKMFWQLPGLMPEALTGHQWRNVARQHF